MSYYQRSKFQFCEKRIVSNPKGINRKKLVPFVLLINAQRRCKEKLNMTDKVKYESRCNWTFSKKETKYRLLFFEKIRFEDFWKTGRNENSDRWDSVWISILSGGCTEGGALCSGNAKGRSSMLGLRGKAHYRVKGETPCPVIWCLRQVVLGIIWRIVLPKIIFGDDRHMKKSMWNARDR